MLSEVVEVDTEVGLDSISIKLLEILRESVLPFASEALASEVPDPEQGTFSSEFLQQH